MTKELFIPQDLIRDAACTGFDVSIWCATLMDTYGPFKTKSMISASQVAYQIKEGYTYTRNLTSDTADSLRFLMESGYLKGERLDQKHYEILLSSFDVSDYKYFVRVSAEDIRTIWRSGTRPYSTLRYYLLFLSTIDPKTKCGIWSNESLAGIVGESAATVSRHFAPLEKLELLYVYRGLYRTNTYGRYEDKEAIVALGEERSNGCKISKGSRIRRRMTQMYNQVKKGHKYDETTMAELFEYCQNVNDQEKEMADNQVGYEPNFYDLSIFSVDFACDAS